VEFAFEEQTFPIFLLLRKQQKNWFGKKKLRLKALCSFFWWDFVM
jgi:hypothetical protein